MADFGVSRVQDDKGIMTAETGTYRYAPCDDAMSVGSLAHQLAGATAVIKTEGLKAGDVMM